MRRVADVVKDAHALTVFRAPSGEGREYTATTFLADPRVGCARFIRMCGAVGWIEDGGSDGYGVLDVLDERGDIVQDFTIPDASAFRQITKRLKLRVVHPDPLPARGAARQPEGDDA